ncbi:MAG: LD-carboxypeptidase [Bacteroidales bacterium]|nr:LD-carboxypeptidase [Bacteroidales bacterium]
MTFPPYLHPDDCVGIVAPARKVAPAEIKAAINFLEKNGFRVAIGKNLFNKHFQFAGTDEERAQDFQEFMDDPEIHAIWCARGGYGSVRIIDKLDFQHFKERPKWICGYSDITVFHAHLHTLGLASLHCTMPIKISNDDFDNMNNRSMIQALTGGILAYTMPNSSINRSGMAVGEIIGGNLSILYSLLASPSDLQTDGKILFIEDLDEHLYHIDRMMQALKRSGKLNKLAGLIVGGMEDMHNNNPENPFGQTAEEIVASCCEEYSYPICYHFPVGHGDNNVALKMGARVTLSVAPNGGALIFNE